MRCEKNIIFFKSVLMGSKYKVTNFKVDVICWLKSIFVSWTCYCAMKENLFFATIRSANMGIYLLKLKIKEKHSLCRAKRLSKNSNRIYRTENEYQSFCCKCFALILKSSSHQQYWKAFFSWLQLSFRCYCYYQ